MAQAAQESRLKALRNQQICKRQLSFIIEKFEKFKRDKQENENGTKN